MQKTAAGDEGLFRSTAVADSILASVRALYERYPYPHYPLLAKPRWQEGWQTASRFSSRLAAWRTGSTSDNRRKRILIAGCGEILPAVICAQEPGGYRIDAIDLSAKSLRRAWFRCASEVPRLRLRQADVPQWFADHPVMYDHIDCYGVLHHLARPLASLKGLAGALRPGGTARVMVYNSPARNWIHHWQQVLRGLRIDPASGGDVALAMQLLRTAGRFSQPLAALLSQMGPSALTSKTRFADTFLHPREARIGPAAWVTGVADAGLTLIGIYDRYQECDDLPNPLWGISPDTLVDRVQTGALQGNLEFFLQRPGGVQSDPGSDKRFSSPARAAISLLVPSPRAWWSTEETEKIPLAARQFVWVQHRQHLAHGTGTLSDSFLSAIGQPALRRLARMGAVLPGQLSEVQRQIAGQPLTTDVPTGETVRGHSDQSVTPAPVTELIATIGQTKGLSERRRQLVMRRLARAMNP